MRETREQQAYWAATLAVRQLIAQSKNPRNLIGRMSPTAVAYHAARAAIERWITITGGPHALVCRHCDAPASQCARRRA